MASSSTEPAATASPFPPPSLSSTSTSSDPMNDDEQLQRMLERMSTHTPAAASSPDDDDEDDEGEESWHDAREEEEGDEGEMVTRKEEQELNIDELETLLTKSTSLKAKANTLFLSPSSTSSALSTYLSAISTLPPRPPPPPPSTKPEVEAGTSTSTSEGGVQIEEISEEEAQRIERGETDEEKARKDVGGRIRELRGVCWANVGACYLKMGENKEAVEACTESLLDSPTYVKALHRRATANVAINTWSSLTSAQDDLKTLLPLLPSSPPSALYKQSKTLLASLPPKLKEKQDKEKDEMIDKLKGLGNSVLGRFGLSTENFKFEPNGAGGYSMNFVR